MNENSKYTIQSAIKRIEDNRGKVSGKTIHAHQPGIKVWGVIDFLLKNGYVLVRDT